MSAALAASVVFALLGLFCVSLVGLGLPGGVGLVVLAVAVEAADGLWLGPGASTFGWGWVGAATVLVAIGETLEVVSGVLGIKATGGSRRGMWGALLGGLAGGLGFTVLVPIPVVGTLVGALLGTFGGALLAETTGEAARSAQASLVPALGATLARVVGLFFKFGFCLTAWLVLVVAAFAGSAA